MSKTVLVTLAQPKADKMDQFHAYVGGSTELALAADGQVSSRFGVSHVHGDAPATIFGLATFPAAETITTMFDSDEYQALVPGRDESIDCVNAYIVDDSPATELADPDGVYLITVAAPNPEAMEDLQAYQQVAGPLAGKHGGKPVVNFPVSGRPVGETPAAFIGLTEFPSAEAIEGYFNDDDYLAVVDKRDRALSSLNVYVTN